MSNPVEAPVAAVTDTATGLVGLMKKHPGGALLVFAILILVVLRYRNTIVGLFSKVPIAGPRAAAFAAGGPAQSTPPAA